MWGARSGAADSVNHTYAAAEAHTVAAAHTMLFMTAPQ